MVIDPFIVINRIIFFRTIIATYIYRYNKHVYIYTYIHRLFFLAHLVDFFAKDITAALGCASGQPEPGLLDAAAKPVGISPRDITIFDS